jgi:5'-nucleotidase
MKITVNNTQVDLHHGARVRDAIMKYYSESGRKMPGRLPAVEDRYGNPVAPDGELTEGNALFLAGGGRKRTSAIRLGLIAITLGIAFSCSGTRHAGKSPVPEIQGTIAGTTGSTAVIFAVNDIHAAIDNFPKLAWIVDSLKTIYPDMLLVSAGDNQTGNPVNDQYPEKGWPVIDLMNATGFDLSAIGNHEFDSSPRGFGDLTRRAGFSFISANLSADSTLNVKFSPYLIFTLPNRLKIAFLGLLQVSANGIPDTHPDNTKGFSYRSPFETAGGYIWLKDSSDILVALTHIGFEEDVKLAGTMPAGIDLIIGGHSHTRVEKEQVHNGILITQAENKLKYGTLIKITVGSDGKVTRGMQLIDIRNSAKEKPAIRAMVDRYNDNPVLNEVIAVLTGDFSSAEELGYLMADAQRDAAGADIALMNPGGVRLDRLAGGPVTVKNVYQLDPFGNELIVTKLSGEEIYSLMKAAWPVDDNSPLYPSGIRIYLTAGHGDTPSAFVLKTEDGALLDKNRVYSVAMNSYMTQVYKYDHSDPGQSLFITTAEALIRYLKKQNPVRSYGGEKRIQVAE